MSAVPTAGARRAFVDSSAFAALTVVRDVDHARAKVVRTRLTTERWRLFTTNFIVAETHALLIAREGREVAASTLREIDRSATTIVRADEADELRAREIVYQYTDKDFSLADAISFAVMERLGIGHAFTFDRHFAQYGFTVLAPGAVG